MSEKNVAEFLQGLQDKSPLSQIWALENAIECAENEGACYETVIQPLEWALWEAEQKRKRQAFGVVSEALGIKK